MAFTGDQYGKRVLKAQGPRPYNLHEPVTTPAEFFSGGLHGSAAISIPKAIKYLKAGWLKLKIHTRAIDKK